MSVCLSSDLPACVVHAFDLRACVRACVRASPPCTTALCGVYYQFHSRCVEIKNHLESLLPHGHRVWLMVLYFKVGANNKLWWLWCGSARLQNRKGQVRSTPTGPICSAAATVAAQSVVPTQVV
jgi:hypothetical protein